MISVWLLLAVSIPSLPTAPEACAELAQRLRAPRKASAAQFRPLLDAIGAEYPNDIGQFVPKSPPPQPKRKRGEPPPPPPKEADWLTDLANVTVTPDLETARAEAVELVATLRALAATKRYDKACAATRVMLDFAFEDLAGVFRDEVGRQVRAMGSYSLPPLIRVAWGRGRVAKGERRYANYQLDRMDRQRPETVMAQVHDDPVRAEILRAYGETRPPNAVHAVLGECDASSPRVRRSARWAWKEYVTRKPPDPPKRKLKLQGGKESDEEKELYLSYRELADLEIRRQWPALMNEPADPQKSLKELSDVLFAKQDAERNKRWDALFAQADAKRSAGDLPGALSLYGWILAQDPFYGRRAEMVPCMRDHARKLAQEGKWTEAAGWLRQARALGNASLAQELDRELAHAEGEASMAMGSDDPSAFERLLLLDPENAQARSALRTLHWRRFERDAKRKGSLGTALLALALACSLMWRRVKASPPPPPPPEPGDDWPMPPPPPRA